MQICGPLISGSNSTINATTPTALTSTFTPVVGGIIIQAPAGNSQIIYLGGSNVTSANGFALAAGGSSPLLHINDVSKLYAISATGTQAVNWIGG
jgi:hypothetical protein